MLLAAKRHVISRYFREQCHQSGSPSFDLRFVSVSGRLNGTSRSAEHVDFPTGIKPRLIKI